MDPVTRGVVGRMSAPPEPLPQGVPHALTEVRHEVDLRLEDVLRAERQRWSAFDPLLAEPLEQLCRFSIGGKRLRPAFCHWGHVAAGGDPADRTVLDAGAALELLHVFALVHDDVMDGSDLRRGAPTVHRHFEDRHESHSWSGESRRFGEGVAVLVGDLALVLADGLLTGAGPTAWQVFNELRVELVMGQFLDVCASAAGDADARTSQRISLFKTAKYTVERPLHLGAALAGRLDELADTFSDYGLALGEAFQLRDDVLGAYGDRAVVGKPVGDDFREGKQTRLVVHALEVAQREQLRPALDALGRIGDPALGPADVVAIQEVLEATGARDAVEHRIEDLLASAVGALDRADIEPGAREALVDLALYCGRRDR
jgi:geranylgeranyl diphosphate synthase, type I